MGLLGKSKDSPNSSRSSSRSTKRKRKDKETISLKPGTEKGLIEIYGRSVIALPDFSEADLKIEAPEKFKSMVESGKKLYRQLCEEHEKAKLEQKEDILEEKEISVKTYRLGNSKNFINIPGDFTPIASNYVVGELKETVTLKPVSTEIRRCSENFFDYRECNPGNCIYGNDCETADGPNENVCRNRRLQNGLWADFSLKYFEGKGFGVVANREIPQHSLICEYIGEIINNSIKEKRHNGLSGPENWYMMELTAGIYVDSKSFGSVGRYLNHSCDPNCIVRKMTVNGIDRLGMYALKPIKPNEELTYDYKFDLEKSNYELACLCGSSNCPGIFGMRKTKPLTQDEGSDVFGFFDESNVTFAKITKREQKKASEREKRRRQNYGFSASEIEEVLAMSLLEK